MEDVSRLTFWHKLGHWPLVGHSFIGKGSDSSHGTHRSHELDTERESQVTHGDLDQGVRVHMKKPGLI